MKSYWMQLKGEHAELEIRDTAIPEPSPTQVLVRVKAASLNRGEFIVGHGLHGALGAAKAVGMECAGEVIKAGADTSYTVGDRVMGRCPGAFAQYALIEQRELMAAPTSLTWNEAASLPLTYLVTYDMLVLQGRLAAGEWVLINGVSSGVGVAALQMAKALGARVIGTSGSADKLARLQALGLDVALNTRTPDFYDAVMQATGGKGVNLVVNTVGGSVFAENLRCAAFEARLATVGYVDGVLKADVNIEALHAKRLTLFGVSNKLRTPQQRAEAVPSFVANIMPLVVNGKIKPIVDRVFDFDQLAQAKASMEAGEHLGKIVLSMPSI